MARSDAVGGGHPDRIEDEQEVARIGYRRQRIDLPQDLQFSRRHLMASEQRLVGRKLAPTFGLARLAGFPISFGQMLRVRMDEEQQFLPIEPEGIGETAEQPERRIALAIFDIRDVAGLDAYHSREVALGQPEGIACLFDKEPGFLLGHL